MTTASVLTSLCFLWMNHRPFGAAISFAPRNSYNFPNSGAVNDMNPAIVMLTKSVLASATSRSPNVRSRIPGMYTTSQSTWRTRAARRSCDCMWSEGAPESHQPVPSPSKGDLRSRSSEQEIMWVGKSARIDVGADGGYRS